MVCLCEYGHASLGFIKVGELTGLVSDYKLLKKDYIATEWVILVLSVADVLGLNTDQRQTILPQTFCGFSQSVHLNTSKVP
jgi:hypothetical protein